MRGGLATRRQGQSAHLDQPCEAAVPDGAAAPVVGHGDGIEPGLVACFPGADYESWGAPFGHCDGARLGLDDGRSSVSSSAGRRGSCAGEAKSGGR
jgi:hypothetical protein